MTVKAGDGLIDASWQGYGVGYDLQAAEATEPMPQANGGFGLNASVRSVRKDGLKNGVEYNVVLFTYCYGPYLCDTQTAKATPIPKPAAFEITSVELLDGGDASVSWGDALNATSYSVRYGTSTGDYPVRAAENATSPTLLKRLPSGQVFVRVFASNDSGETPSSSEVAVDVPIRYNKISGAVTGHGGQVTVSLGDRSVVVGPSEARYEFADVQADLSYKVKVAEAPEGQTCSVAAPGSIDNLIADVTDADITCSGDAYTVGGTVSGLVGSLTLLVNGQDEQSISADGAFTFSTSLASGASYEVTVGTQPTGQICDVANGTGTVTGAVTNVEVSCTTQTYTIGGTVTGLASGTLSLQLDGGASLSVSSNGAFTFPNEIASGTTYTVSVATQPDGLFCSVANGSGTVEAEDVSNVTVTCNVAGELVSVSVSGLSGSLQLRINDTQDLDIASNGSFSFAAPLDVGSSYSVAITQQPAGQTCTLSNASGTVVDSGVSVGVSCASNTYTLSGTVSGLTGTLKLKSFATGEILTITTNGNFTFTQPVSHGVDRDVRATVHPVGQVCTLTNDSGATTADVNNITATCVAAKFIFLANSTDGDLGGVAGADNYCDSEKPAGDSNTYKALISDGSTRIACTSALCSGGTGGRADWPLAANTTYYRLADAQPIGTTNGNALFPLPLTSAFATGGGYYWTGLNDDWTSATDDCDDWGDGSSMANGAVGQEALTTSDAISKGPAFTCDAPFLSIGVLCIQQ